MKDIIYPDMRSSREKLEDTIVELIESETKAARFGGQSKMVTRQELGAILALMYDVLRETK